MKNIVMILSLFFYCSTAFALKQAERAEQEIYSYLLSGISLSMSSDEAKQKLESNGFKLMFENRANTEQKTWQYSKGNTIIIISESMNSDILSMIDISETAPKGEPFNIQRRAATISSSWRFSESDFNNTVNACFTRFSRSGVVGKSVVFGGCNVTNSASGIIEFHATLNMMQIHQRLVRTQTQQQSVVPNE